MSGATRSVYMYAFIYVCLYVCMYLRTYVCIYECRPPFFFSLPNHPPLPCLLSWFIATPDARLRVLNLHFFIPCGRNTTRRVSFLTILMLPTTTRQVHTVSPRDNKRDIKFMTHPTVKSNIELQEDHNCKPNMHNVAQDALREKKYMKHATEKEINMYFACSFARHGRCSAARQWHQESPVIPTHKLTLSYMSTLCHFSTPSRGLAHPHNRIEVSRTCE